MYRPGPIKVLFRGPWTYITCTRKGDGPGPHGPRMTRIKGLWAVLFEVEDADVREDLALVEFMAIRFRWPASRTRRRLQGLVDLGVLRCSRDLADNWTKVYEVIDRPHVPAAFALEMAG